MPPRNRPASVVTGELRPSQIITTFGPGAVVDQRSASVIAACLDLWEVGEDQRIDEPRLSAMLRVRALYRPRVKTDRGMRGIPAFPFPEMLVCPRCDRLGHFSTFYFDGRRFRCRNRARHPAGSPAKGPVVFPARFVVACPAGHLEDFPWDAYVHRGRAGSCSSANLTFFEGKGSGALSDLFVRCGECEKSRPMEDAFGDDTTRALGTCGGGRPWVAPGDHEPGCQEDLRTVLRGASNLYFSVVQSALSIPEWDDPVHAAIAYYGDMDAIKSRDDMTRFYPVLERLQGFSPDHVWEALEARRNAVKTPPTPLSLRLEEFRALRARRDPMDQEDREFQTEHVAVPAPFRPWIERVVIVRRLREVRALDGFTRIDSPPDPLLEGDEHTEDVKKQELFLDDPGWRPAVELLGEGVFVELDDARVSAWTAVDAVAKRMGSMDEAYAAWRSERSLPEAPFPGARFVLLHSLAHMLIQALALDCGYSSTAIRERIYSSDDVSEPMAGLLLYTATPDSDGSLGGLADQGRPRRFEQLLRDALHRATYCSSDPLCGHTPPGTAGNLNGAACHACLLVAETSCERSNRFLDRAHVVPTVAALGAEYFDA